MVRVSVGRCLVGLLTLVAAARPAAAQMFPPKLSDPEVAEVRAALDAMRRDIRGPYLRIRWFCNDGTIQPPQGAACRERGGGVQHAEFNDRAKRLAQLGVHVGTILQATSFDEFRDSARAGYRLRELVLAHYLEEIDDGWVLRRARFYRGARQIEDEEQKGKQQREQLLATPAWTARNFLLASQLVAVIPHVGQGGEQRTQRIRNLATEIAVMDTTFLDIRIKIHSFPSRADIDAVDRFLGSRSRSAAVRDKLQELRTALREQYDETRTLEVLGQYRRRLPGPLGERVGTVETALRQGRRAEAFRELAELSLMIRREVTQSRDGRRNLLLMDLNHAVEQQAFVSAQAPAAASLAPPAASAPAAPALRRRDRVAALGHYFALAHGAGFLSGREHAALTTEIAELTGAGAGTAGTSITALEYRQRLRTLARSIDWGNATVAAVFRPVTERYLQFEPKTEGFADALVRGSVMLPLSQALDRLLADADRVLGTSHVLLGQPVSSGLRGLNPGVALRPLDIARDERAGATLDADKIYVIPEATPEMRPVAGVLTLGEGNLLSHVQLLARNLGIPNAAMAPALLHEIEPARGDTVFYAVSPLGRVVLKRARAMTAEERQLVEQGRAVKTTRHRLDTSRLKLSVTRPIPLTELGLAQSGVVVGPKAANLGQLRTYFPDRVSKGVALPFGMFYQHVNRPFESDRTVLEDLRAAYDEAARLRVRGHSEAEIDQFMFEALAKVRRAILELDWLPESRAAIVAAIHETFGRDLSGGVFVRSDTNVEDLPEFSGAGLNLTVPHQRLLDAVLASIKRVWTSPFSERAYLWRRQILDDQAAIYPSVLLLESVPSEKSGVLISSGLQFGGPTDLTIATAEGVGGAVEGEEAEAIVVARSGSIRLLSQAKAPYRRLLKHSSSGGVEMLAAQLPDTLLGPNEIRQLQSIVDAWKARVPEKDASRVWDIEFGVVRGKVWLFQIRPFVRFRSSDLLKRLEVLDRATMSRGQSPISLDESAS